MGMEHTALVLGGTGRTGARVLQQLLDRGFDVRVVVRSVGRLPAGVSQHPRVTVLEADVLSLGDAELLHPLRGCGAVISCLGHSISLKGVFGPPRDLVTQVTARLCRAIEALHPAAPMRFILMSSVSVNHPGHAEARRGRAERGLLAIVRGLLPPARDNQRAADYLWRQIGTGHPFVRWVAVRPDTLVDGDVSAYAAHEAVVSGLFTPARTHRANVAHFMGRLAADAGAWNEWVGRMPVVVDADVSAGRP